MQLLLFRHGIAEDAGPGVDDAARKLTDEGVKKTRLAARGLSKIIASPGVILASPLTRARQTARILHEVFDVEPTECPALAGHDLEAILREVGKQKHDVVILVGHEPTFSSLAETLLTGQPPRGVIEMKKAGCIGLELDWRRNKVGGARLIWLATPGMLREMAE